MLAPRSRRLLKYASLLLAAGLLVYLACLAALQSCPRVRWAMEQARADPKIVSAIGSPMEKGWIWEGSVAHFTPGGGTSDFAIPLRGPKGEGTLRVRVFDDIGVFKLRRSDFEPAATQR
jgi:hypothetical protein